MAFSVRFAGRLLSRRLVRQTRFYSADATSSNNPEPGTKEEIWQNPWKHIHGIAELPKPEYTDYVVSEEEFKYVEDVLPIQSIPEPPPHSSYPTPSGWYPPSPDESLPYYVRRTRYHLFPTFLERRRDQLDPETYEFNYVELVVLKQVEGDVFACEKDIREFLEKKLGRNIGTHANELQGIIRIKGADRVDVEQFLVSKRL